MPKTLIHISDLHFVNDQTLLKGLWANKKFFSKQHLGWLNYKLRRHRHFNPVLKERIASYLLTTVWDYLIVTGDLTTLSLESEFIAARHFMEPLIRKGIVLFTTGNHDRYIQTYPNTNLLAVYFQDCWPFNKNTRAHSFYEINEHTVILELPMAVPRPFYSSRGKLAGDLAALKHVLESKYHNRTKIVIGHYPAFLPPSVREGFFHSLAGKAALRQFLSDGKIDFYLHGHIHKSWMFTPAGSPQLTCINSGGCCRHANGADAGFHKILLTAGGATIERIRL